MSRMAAFAVGVLVLALGAATAGAQEDRGGPPFIEAIGRAEMTAAPDLAELLVAVETEAEDARTAAQRNAEISERVLAALRERVGEDGEVSTTGYHLEPRYHYPSGDRPGPREPQIIGYTARNQVRVETRELASVGGLIDAAIAAGANRVNSLSFTLDERSAVRREALQEASRDAFMQATAIAGALDLRVVGVLEASTMSVPTPRPVQARLQMDMEMAQQATPIEPGEVHLDATVRVRFEVAASGGS